jgi:hypothetical protein
MTGPTTAVGRLAKGCHVAAAGGLCRGSASDEAHAGRGRSAADNEPAESRVTVTLDELPGARDDDLRDSPPVHVTLLIVGVAAVLALPGCDDDDGAGDAEQFCADVADNVEALRAIPATDDAVDDLIELWRDIGDDAPLAIEAEWDEHTDNLELAWTSDDQQEVVASAFASERSAVTVAAWLNDNCGIDFGPVTTIVPGSLPTSTLPGTSRTSTTTPA